jgi:hypothetical protein
LADVKMTPIRTARKILERKVRCGRLVGKSRDRWINAVTRDARKLLGPQDGIDWN